MRSNELIFEKLIQSTVDIMVTYGISEPESQQITRKKNNDNFWNKVCLAYHGQIDYNKMLRIHAWWIRNTQNYREQSKATYREIQNKKTKEVPPQIEKMVIPIDIKSLNTFYNFIVYYKNGRSKFNSSFTDYLSSLIQKKGINCWLSCKYNWIRQTNSQKQCCPFWRGSYVCIDINCRNKFDAAIFDNLNIQDTDQVNLKGTLIFINYSEQKKHGCKLRKKIRCTGEKRELLAKELILEGTTNIISEHILHNDLTDNCLGKQILKNFFFQL